MSARISFALCCGLIAGCGGSPPAAGPPPAQTGQSAAPAPAPVAAPTFTKDIAPILFANCASCHRPGQAAPFTLLSYSDAKQKADKIADATGSRHMPPWLPERGEVPFAGERRLRDDQIATIARWVATGAPEGDPQDLPPVPAWPEGWQLGTPDLVVTMPRGYMLAPGKDDVFRNVLLPLALPAGRYVRAVEFRPNGAPVHHAVINIDRTRASRRRDGADGKPGYDGMITQDAQSPDGHFLGWTPGQGPIVAPQGLPWRLDRGADLVVQLHLLPGKTAIDVKPSIGLFFAEAPASESPLMIKMGSKAIDIPAGAANYAIDDTFTLPVDVDLLGLYPHAHYLGKEMQAYALLPDGTTRWILRIKHWSFHWQQDYRFTAPIALPRGTKLTMRYTYDNSAANEHNRRKPPVPVRYGPNSTDEMGDLWLQVLPKSSADAAVLRSSFDAREKAANVAGAEAQMRHSPEDPKTRTFLGSSYAAVGRMAEARTHLEYALGLDPKSASAHNFLAGVLFAAGRAEEGIAHFRQAAALAPTDERMQFNLGNALNAIGRPDEAAAAFRRAIAINPEFAVGHQNLGVYLESRGRLAEAITHLTRAADLLPESAEVHSDLGAVLAEAGRTAEAIQHFQRALQIRPDYAPARENLARIRR